MSQAVQADSASPTTVAKNLIWSAVASIGLLTGAATAQTPPTAHPSTELPAGQGRDTVMKVCSKCHSPNILVANPRDRQGWEDTITKMSGLGAMATDDEFTEILDYLGKNVTPQAMAKININKASSADLQKSMDLTPKDADALVAYRTKNGDFKTLDDVKKVPEIDAAKVDAKKDKLTF